MANDFFDGGTSGDWATAANWRDGTVPILTDTPLILTTTRAITGCPTDAGDLDYTGFEVGPDFGGTLATAALPLFIGSVPHVRFNGRHCQGAFISIGTGKTVPRFNVQGTGAGQYPLYIGGPGTITALEVYSSSMVIVASGPTVTGLYLVPKAGNLASVTLESGLELTNVYMAGGLVLCSSEVGITPAGVLNMTGGIWEHKGLTTYNVGTLNIWGGVFKFFSKGGTITACNVYGGKVDLNGGLGDPRIITTLNQYGGEVNRKGLGALVTITTNNQYGGEQYV